MGESRDPAELLLQLGEGVFGESAAKAGLQVQGKAKNSAAAQQADLGPNEILANSLLGRASSIMVPDKAGDLGQSAEAKVAAKVSMASSGTRLNSWGCSMKVSRLPLCDVVSSTAYGPLP